MPTKHNTMPGQDNPCSWICQRASKTIAPPIVLLADHRRKFPFSLKICETSKAIARASQGFTLRFPLSSVIRLLLRSICNGHCFPVTSPTNRRAVAWRNSFRQPNLRTCRPASCRIPTVGGVPCFDGYCTTA